MEKYLDMFCAYMKIKNYSERTIAEYRFDLTHFIGYLKNHTITKLTDMTHASVYQYQRYLLAEHMSPRGKRLHITTQSKILTVIRSYCAFLAKEQYLVYNPASELELPKLPKVLPRDILTKREIKKLFQSADLGTPHGYRDRVMLELLYATGMRQSELLRLRIGDINRDHGEVRITCGKGGKDRIVPLCGKTLQYLDRYLHTIRPCLYTGVSSSYLFMNQRGGVLVGAAVARRLKYLAGQAGITKKVTFHTFRHTCATHLLQGKASIRHIQAVLGHASLETTQRYTKVDITDLKKVIQASHPREKMILA